MRSRVRRGFLVAAVVAAAAPGYGGQGAPALGKEPPIDARTGLAVDAAVARALGREPSLRAVRTEIEAARGARQQAALRPNPTLSIERRDEPRGTDSVSSVGLAWPLDLFRRQGRVQTADRELTAVGLAVEDRERLLASDVRMEYGAAAAAIRDAEVAAEVAGTARRQFEIVRARADAGGTPPLERDLLDVELRRFEVAQFLAEGQAEAALVRLKQTIDMSPDESLQLRDTIEGLVARGASEGAPVAPSVPEARADVREADARVAVADARVVQARREGRADVSLFGTYMRMDAGFPQQGVTPSGGLERVRGRFNYVAGGMMVMLPLFNRNQGEVAVARAERSGAEARREAVALAARAEAASARARYEQAQRAVGLYAGGMRALTRQNLDVTRQTFDLGRATVFDVLIEQRRYLEIEQAYTATLREAWEARTALIRALGETR